MRYRYHVNLGGVLYLAATVLVGAAATIRPNNLLVWVFGLLLGLIVLSGIISGTMLMRVRITRLDPVHGRVGKLLSIRYAVANRGRLIPLFDLRITERKGEGLWNSMDVTEAWVMHAGPGETVHTEAVMVPKRRGRLRFVGIVGFSSFPMGFIGKSVRIRQPMETLIFPRTVPLKETALDRLIGREGVGARAGRKAGQTGDYFGLREYLPGDSLRMVAWKRTRPDESLVVKQRSISSPPRMVLVLDLRRPTSMLRLSSEGGASARNEEERAISLLASLAETAMERGVEFGLHVLGTDLVPLGVRSGRRHLFRVMSHLAAIDLDAERMLSTGISVRPAQGSVVVIHPDRVDPSIGGPSAWHLLPSSLEIMQTDAPSEAVVSLTDDAA